MYLVRLLTVALIVPSSSLSGGMAPSHAVSVDQDMSAMVSMSDDNAHCCEDSMDRSQSCHVLPALVPALDMNGIRPNLVSAITFENGILLTGIEPCGPLDPPRAV